jgi:hypothetical protein
MYCPYCRDWKRGRLSHHHMCCTAPRHLPYPTTHKLRLFVWTWNVPREDPPLRWGCMETSPLPLKQEIPATGSHPRACPTMDDPWVSQWNISLASRCILHSSSKCRPIFADSDCFRSQIDSCNLNCFMKTRHSFNANKLEVFCGAQYYHILPFENDSPVIKKFIKGPLAYLVRGAELWSQPGDPDSIPCWSEFMGLVKKISSSVKSGLRIF